MAEFGWDERWQEQLAELRIPGTEPARVLRHDGKQLLVGSPAGTSHIHLRASTAPVAVGDWVLIDDEAVHHVLDRRSLLQRRDPSTGNQQLIAANIDVVGVVCGLDRPVRSGRIERFVTLAFDAGAAPMVVLTKTDLVEDSPVAGDIAVDSIEAENTEAENIAAASAPGAEVVGVSSFTGSGIDRLRSLLDGTTVVFVGESGAGKSALVNALTGQDVAGTGDVRGGDHKGRHTTTARQLHSLPSGGWVIDTPGVREVGLWTDTDTVDHSFTDIAELADGCRFRDCTHASEPGCAVRQAVDDETLSAGRLENWERMHREAASAELRADTHAHRQAGRRFGKMVREAKKHNRR